MRASRRLACAPGGQTEALLVLATALDATGASGTSQALSSYVEASCSGPGGPCRGEHIRAAVLEAWRMDHAACAWGGVDEWMSRLAFLRVLIENEIKSCTDNGGAATEGRPSSCPNLKP